MRAWLFDLVGSVAAALLAVGVVALAAGIALLVWIVEQVDA